MKDGRVLPIDDTIDVKSVHKTWQVIDRCVAMLPVHGISTRLESALVCGERDTGEGRRWRIEDVNELVAAEKVSCWRWKRTKKIVRTAHLRDFV